jgi:hypothetical protein
MSEITEIHQWHCMACLHDFTGSLEDWVKPCPNCGLDQVMPQSYREKVTRVASVKTINGKEQGEEN